MWCSRTGTANALSHTAETTAFEVSLLGFSTVSQPPYSTDLAPFDFAIFPTIKAQLKGHRFQSLDDLKVETSRITQQYGAEWYRRVYTQWVDSHHKCMGHNLKMSWRCWFSFKLCDVNDVVYSGHIPIKSIVKFYIFTYKLKCVKLLSRPCLFLTTLVQSEEAPANDSEIRVCVWEAYNILAPIRSSDMVQQLSSLSWCHFFGGISGPFIHVFQRTGGPTVLTVW